MKTLIAVTLAMILVLSLCGSCFASDYGITASPVKGPFEHGRIGDCIYIEASQIKNTDQMPEHLQAVYIIPASDGCIVATAHCYLAESGGYLRRFSYMVKTISPLGN